MIEEKGADVLVLTERGEGEIRGSCIEAPHKEMEVLNETGIIARSGWEETDFGVGFIGLGEDIQRDGNIVPDFIGST